MCQYGQHVRIGGKSVHIGRKVSVLAHPKIIVVRAKLTSTLEGDGVRGENMQTKNFFTRGPFLLPPMLGIGLIIPGQMSP